MTTLNLLGQVLTFTQSQAVKGPLTDGPLKNGAAPPRHPQGVEVEITSPREQNRAPVVPGNKEKMSGFSH